MSRPSFPPFDAVTTAQRARLAENAWNGRQPARVALAHIADSRGRNRTDFIQGSAALAALQRVFHRPQGRRADAHPGPRELGL